MGTPTSSIPTRWAVGIIDNYPLYMTNLAFWLRADQGIPIINGAVSQWDFINGDFRGVSNAVQAAGGSQPNHIEFDSAYNFQSTIDFDGGDFLDSAVFSSVLAQPSTYLIIGNIGVDANEVFIDKVGAGANRNQITSRGPASSDWAMFSGATIDSALNNNTNPHIIQSIFNGANSKMFLDDVSIITANAGVQGLASLRIGDNIVLSGGLTGKVAEIVAINGKPWRIKIENHI